MTFQDFIASRHHGIKNVYYAGGQYVLHREGNKYSVVLGNGGKVGTFEECQAALYDYYGYDVDWSVEAGDQLEFEPEPMIAGMGTEEGMCALLQDYCEFFGLEHVSADEMLADPARAAHHDWIKLFCSIWDDVMQAENKPDATTLRLARMFGALVREAFTGEELEDIITENRKRGKNGSCATHDYMDANALMYGAWCAVFFQEPDRGKESDVAKMEAAWTAAIEADFYV